MYSAVVLDEKSHLKLVKWADDNIKVGGVRLPVLVSQNGWKLYCHQMIIQSPGIPEYVEKDVDEKQTLEITHIGTSDKVVAVRVLGYPSTNKIPHIVIATNIVEDEPIPSNKITNWKPVESGTKFNGTVKKVN
jgi:spore cortex formation protein SpoVR/YcgB (stage V sporulation)